MYERAAWLSGKNISFNLVNFKFLKRGWKGYTVLSPQPQASEPQMSFGGSVPHSLILGFYLDTGKEDYDVKEKWFIPGVTQITAAGEKTLLSLLFSVDNFFIFYVGASYEDHKRSLSVEDLRQKKQEYVR